MPIEIDHIQSVQESADRLAVAHILYLHGYGLNRLDETTPRSAYWLESGIDYGSYTGHAHVFATIAIIVLSQQYAPTRHSLSNTRIDFDDLAQGDHCNNDPLYAFFQARSGDSQA